MIGTDNLIRNNMDKILEKDIILFSPHEQLLIFCMCFLPTSFTLKELCHKANSFFGPISEQVIIKNLRVLKGRDVVAELGCHRRDRRVKAYGLKLKGIALALILSEMVGIYRDDYAKTDLMFRKIYHVKGYGDDVQG